MPRDVDERKKRKALRKLRKAASLAEQGLGPPLSEWEQQFLDEVEQRIEKYGSAFNDLEKGGSDEALSALQQVKLREIDKKARGKGRSGFSNRGGFKRKTAPRVRQVDEDLNEGPEEAPQAKPGLQLVKASELSPTDRPPRETRKPRARPKFRVIDGGGESD